MCCLLSVSYVMTIELRSYFNMRTNFDCQLGHIKKYSGHWQSSYLDMSGRVFTEMIDHTCSDLMNKLTHGVNVKHLL